MSKTTFTQGKDLLSDIIGEKQANVVILIGGSLVALYVFGVAFKVLTNTAINYRELQNALKG